MKELITGFNPQPEVRKAAENAPDWEFAEEAKYLYRMAVNIRDRLVDPLHRLDRKRLPEPVIAFEDLRNRNTLAAFRLTRNPDGLENEIILNSEHYRDVNGKKEWIFGRWAQAETLCHELVHEFQQVCGKEPVKLGRIYHNKEFVAKCESIGLHPQLGAGCHTRIADGAFEIYMKELGISKPETEGLEVFKTDWYKALAWPEKKEGRSTLHRYECPACHLKIRVGVKDNPFIAHMPCTIKLGELIMFVNTDSVSQPVYQAPEVPEQHQEEVYNPADDPEDLTTYLEPYQND